MITIKPTAGKDQPKPLTVEELIAGIGSSLEQTKGVISSERLHSVDSHLRSVIKILGFKPRETVSDGKITTPVTELLKQLAAAWMPALK